MQATIITIGDEILIGQIVDTNSAYIAKALNTIGIEVHEIISIADSKQNILETLTSIQNKVEVVIITGGLGPTKDDITKKTLCEYFDDTLVVDAAVLKHVTTLIEEYFKRPISQINKDQALVPSKCEVLFNKIGTAPGIWLQKENTTFISLPGVPYEMKEIINEVVIPKLIARFNRPFILHKTILTYGVGESLLAERIEKWENNLPHFIKLAYLPSPGKVRLRLTAKGMNKEILQSEVEMQIINLEILIPDCLVGYSDDESIEYLLSEIFKQKNYTLSTAESCTGGAISAKLTTISGASSYFKGGIVSYATQAKIEVLKVSETVIQKNSVVSHEVAKEMALNAQKMFQTNFAISTTGNAGPNKGDSNAEIGTIIIAIATPKEVFTEEFSFKQPREIVINRTVNKALEIIYKEILKNY
jgi:nicotinamide-nucleotide amidase